MKKNIGVDLCGASYEDPAIYIINFKPCLMVTCVFFLIFLWAFVTQWDLLFFYNMTPCILINVLQNRVEVKAIYALEQEMKAQKGSRYIATLFL